jgi:hypothetical protein
MQFVEAEVARLLADDPAVEAARKRAVRRAGRATAARAPGHELLAAH